MKKRSKKFNYTKAEIEHVIASLLVDEKKLGQWHSPKGVFPRRREAITLNLNTQEHWVVNHLAKKKKLAVVEMVKWLVINYYFRKEGPQEDLLVHSKHVSLKTQQWLYGYAVRKIKKEEKV